MQARCLTVRSSLGVRRTVGDAQMLADVAAESDANLLELAG